MLGKTFCPLGDAAAMPTMAFVKKFRKEFEDHLEGKPCPFERTGTIEHLPVYGVTRCLVDPRWSLAKNSDANMISKRPAKRRTTILCLMSL